MPNRPGKLPEAAYAFLERLAERAAIIAAEQADGEANQTANQGGGSPTSDGSKPIEPSLEQRAIAYLARVDPAKEGERGHNTTFRAACAVVRMGIDDPEAVFGVLWNHYNDRCRPPWTEAELRHKAEEACKVETRRDLARGREPRSSRCGNGRDQGRGNGDSQGRHGGKEVIEAEDDPHRLARIFRDEHCGGCLVFHRGEFHQWRESAYRPLVDYEVMAQETKAIKAEFNRLNIEAIAAWEAAGKVNKQGEGCPPPVARQVTKRLVGNVDQALKGMTIISGEKDPPLWLVSKPPFAAAEVLPTRNALVHLPSFAAGHLNGVVPPTPAFFCTYALDYDFDPVAPSPAEWHKFLESIWGDDEESKRALQEWFGYLLTPDTRQQTIAFLLGPPRSGRGTIARVIRSLLGNANVAGPTLSGLATNFGLSTLIGKPVAIIGDARLSRRSDAAVVVERLLNLSGEDAVDIDRKNLPLWTGKLPTRFMILANELPRFPDQAGALVSRYLLFRFLKSFVGREDRELDGRLKRELPGILLWAIEGWKRLRERGRFLQPKTGESDLKLARDLNSPVGQWVRERLNEGDGLSVRCDDAFADWKQWCEAKNLNPGTEQALGRNLKAVVPTMVTSDPYRVPGTRSFARDYQGIELRMVF